MRTVVTAPDATAARAANHRLAAAGIECSEPIGPCEIEVSLLAAPAQPGALARLQASSLASVPCTQSDFDGVIALDAPSPQLAQQILAWERIAIGRDELVRRAATAKGLGLPLPGDGKNHPIHALFVGPANPLFLALQRKFTESAGAVSGTHSSCIGLDHLHDQTFDAVILNGADDPQGALSFCAALKRNAALFDLPIMVMAKAGNDDFKAAAVERGASVVLDVSEPLIAPIGWLFEAIRRERIRRATDGRLRALRDLMGDPRTGLWRAAAFEAHIDRMVDDHLAFGRPLSVAALRLLPAPGARAPANDTWRNVSFEVAGLVGRLVREADCATAFSHDQLVLALPTTNLKCARRTSERIASVVECTSFAPAGAFPSPVVLEQSVVTLGPNESGSALIARALSALAPEQLSA